MRHTTNIVNVGGTQIGGNNPVIVQSMTNTDTTDIDNTVKQIIELTEAGSEIVRVTVNNENAAKAIPYIYEKLHNKNYSVPLVGCFHYNGHSLLTRFPECALYLAKYRINPGNVGFGHKKDKQFEMIIETAIKYNKPVRIGVNWGSLDQKIAARLMDENLKLPIPQPNNDIIIKALVESALSSARRAEEIGLANNMIIISAKVSKVNELIKVYRELASQSNYPLHLGLTEAGMGDKGIVNSTAALSILLNEGIGDTIRVSITPKPGDSRTKEVKLCQEILQALGLRSFRPQVSACPGCGRTTSTFFQELADKIQTYLDRKMPVWQHEYPQVAKMNVAVMGCIVNGPGESKHADIGISLPGSGELPIAPVFIDGKKALTLKGNNIAEEFQLIVEQYVHNKYAINKELEITSQQ